VGLEVRRAADRFVTETAGIVSRHSFSFGAHYDPGNVGHALLVAHNDDVVAPGAGYDTHPHRDLEILTWVLDGGLRHEDSRGETGLVVPGLVQRLSAGDGVLHSERNDAATGASVRFVQMWLRPDEPGGEPSYAQHDAGPELSSGELVSRGRRRPARGPSRSGRHGRAPGRAGGARLRGARQRRGRGRRPGRGGRRAPARARRVPSGGRRACWLRAARLGDAGPVALTGPADRSR
jgi:hypothetical protein